MAIVRLLGSCERPSARCRTGDFFVQNSSETGWWVNAWDGREAWDVSGPHGTKDEALEAGRAALNSITATIAANSEMMVI
jgi:hypothetical protein